MTPPVSALLWAAGPDATAGEGIGFFNLAAALIALTALFAYLNHRFVRLPPSIGVMALALAFSLAVVLVGLVVPAVEQKAAWLVRQIDFNKTVLNGMLGFLLFAGALHIDLGDLSSRKTLIAVLATVGVVLTTLIGNHGRAFAMSDTTRDHLDTFWELIDEVLNAVLFVLLGLEVLALSFTGSYLLVGLILIPIVLFARLVSVALPVWLLRLRTPVERYTTRLLCWGGLRGGLSVAMALSVPEVSGGERVAEREWMLTATYVVVAFSILVQGTTVGPLMRRWLRPGPVNATPSPATH